MKPSTAPVKQDYHQFVAKATELIHSPATRDEVIAILKKKSSDPVRAVADTVVMITQRMDNASRKAGVEIEDAVKVIGANGICDQIVELCDVAKIFTLDDRHKELALSVAVQDYVSQEIAAHRIIAGRLKAHMDIAVRKMPPKEKLEMQKAMKRVAETAKEYAASRRVK